MANEPMEMSPILEETKYEGRQDDHLDDEQHREQQHETYDVPLDAPLQYGDLVVVDYDEKKKITKWPAIVFAQKIPYLQKIVPPGRMTDNMLDLPPENDETAVGVRWIERSPT